MLTESKKPPPVASVVRLPLYAMFADYTELPYMPIGMIWNAGWEGGEYSIKPLAANQIMPFLDKFDDEDGMGDPGYLLSDAEPDDFIYYLLDNLDEAAELVYGNGMTANVPDETFELDGSLCYLVYIGANRSGRFIREKQYAISIYGDIYVYDAAEDVWLLVYVFGAFG